MGGACDWSSRTRSSVRTSERLLGTPDFLRDGGELVGRTKTQVRKGSFVLLLSSMIRILEFGLLLSVFPLLVLVEPRLRERRKWLYIFSLSAELIGVSLLVYYLVWLWIAPV